MANNMRLNKYKRGQARLPKTEAKGNGGQAVILTVVFFLIISVSVIASVVVPTANQVKSVRELMRSKAGYIAADAVNADGFYRLRLGQTLPGTLTLPFTAVSASAVVTTGGGATEIKATGSSGVATRFAKTVFNQSETIGLPYALQIGTGGMIINGGSTVIGDVYSNGNIVSDGSGSISGSATAADTSPSFVDVSNGYNNGTPPLSYNFSYTNSTVDLMQSFRVTATVPVTAARIYVKKVGSPANFTLRIVPSGSNGLPSATSLATGNVSASTVTTSFTYVTVPLSPSVSLTPGETYWLIFDSPGAASVKKNQKYYVAAAANNVYSQGLLYTGSYISGPTTSVSPSTADVYFHIYLGGLPTSISGAGQYNRINIGTNGSGFAWSSSVSSASVGGPIYCQSGSYLYNLSGVSQTCNTSRPNPTYLESPITDTMINDWKNTAAAVVQSGDVSIGGGVSTTTGPKKIVGNLTVSGGSTLYLSGPVWVTGTINLEGGGKIRVPSSAGADGAVIIADGRMFTSGGGEFLGSGTTGSYLMAITTSSCSGACSGDGHGNAIDVEGGSGSVILVALNGKVGMYGGAVANNVMAQQLYMEGGSDVIYDSTLSSIGLVGTGGSSSADIQSWEEVSE